MAEETKSEIKSHLDKAWMLAAIEKKMLELPVDPSQQVGIFVHVSAQEPPQTEEDTDVVDIYRIAPNEWVVRSENGLFDMRCSDYSCVLAAFGVYAGVYLIEYEAPGDVEWADIFTPGGKYY